MENYMGIRGPNGETGSWEEIMTAYNTKAEKQNIQHRGTLDERNEGIYKVRVLKSYEFGYRVGEQSLNHPDFQKWNLVRLLPGTIVEVPYLQENHLEEDISLGFIEILNKVEY